MATVEKFNWANMSEPITFYHIPSVIIVLLSFDTKIYILYKVYSPKQYFLKPILFKLDETHVLLVNRKCPVSMAGNQVVHY